MRGDSIVLLGIDENGLPRPLRVNSEDGRLVLNEADDSAWEGASYIVAEPEISLSNEKVLGTDIIMSGTLAVRPAASIAGRLYLATDDNGGTLYRDSSSVWQAVVGGVAPVASANILANAVNVATTETQIVALRADRKRVIIQNTSDTDIYIGPTGVTTANGIRVPTGDISIWLETKAAVLGIHGGSGTKGVRYLEEYG